MKDLEPKPDKDVDVIVQYASDPTDVNFKRAHGKGGELKRHLGIYQVGNV